MAASETEVAASTSSLSIIRIRLHG